MTILQADSSLNSNYCFAGVFNWLYSGGKTAFLQDANSVIMRPPEFIEVLTYLRDQLPSLTRVTSYARSKTLAQRKLEDLEAIRKAGLDRLHVGLETGDDELTYARYEKASQAPSRSKGGRRQWRRASSCPSTGCPIWEDGSGGARMPKIQPGPFPRSTRAIYGPAPSYRIRTTPIYRDYTEGRTAPFLAAPSGLKNWNL